MERKTFDLKLDQSGFTVTIVELLLFGEVKQLKGIFQKGAEVKSVGGVNETTFDGSLEEKYQQKKLEIFVKKVVDDDGKEYPNTPEFLEQNITELDSIALNEAIDSRVEFIKKK